MAQLVSQAGSAATMTPARMSYLDIAKDLADRIERGDYPPGSRLPSYSELAAIYSVSVATVTRALGLLHYQGLIEGVQGVGVFVVQPDGPTEDLGPQKG